MRTNASSVCSCPLVNCFLSRQPISLSRIYQPLSCVDLLWVPLLLLKICFIWPSVHGLFQLTQFQIHLFCCQPIFYAFMCLSNISLLHLLVLNNTVLIKKSQQIISIHLWKKRTSIKEASEVAQQVKILDAQAWWSNFELRNLYKCGRKKLTPYQVVL